MLQELSKNTWLVYLLLFVVTVILAYILLFISNLFSSMGKKIKGGNGGRSPMGCFFFLLLILFSLAVISFVYLFLLFTTLPTSEPLAKIQLLSKKSGSFQINYTIYVGGKPDKTLYFQTLENSWTLYGERVEWSGFVHKLPGMCRLTMLQAGNMQQIKSYPLQSEPSGLGWAGKIIPYFPGLRLDKMRLGPLKMIAGDFVFIYVNEHGLISRKELLREKGENMISDSPAGAETKNEKKRQPDYPETDEQVRK
jgi:hypothetical protein